MNHKKKKKREVSRVGSILSRKPIPRFTWFLGFGFRVGLNLSCDDRGNDKTCFTQIDRSKSRKSGRQRSIEKRESQRAPERGDKRTLGYVRGGIIVLGFWRWVGESRVDMHPSVLYPLFFVLIFLFLGSQRVLFPGSKGLGGNYARPRFEPCLR